MSSPYVINGTIPAANNDPADDQDPMQKNFANIKAFLGVDHVPPGSVIGGTAAGIHRQLNLPTITSPTLQGNLVLYTKLAGGLAALWAKNLTVDAPLTGPLNQVAAGYTTLFGGLSLQWGTVTPVVNRTLTAVTLNRALIFAPYAVVITSSRTASPNNVDQIYINAKSPTTFSYYATTSGTGFASFDWIAIGI